MGTFLLYFSGLVGVIAVITLILRYAIKNASVEKNEIDSPVVKKYPGKDLFRYRGVILNISLIMALTLAIMAFEYKTVKKEKKEEEKTTAKFEEQVQIPNTEIKPPPPPKKQIQQPEVKEAPDKEEIEKELKSSFSDFSDAPVEQPEPPKEPEESVPEKTFDPHQVQVKPEPKGGMGSFYKYLQKNIRYPEKAKRAGLEGKVYVEFVVDKDGKLTNVKVLKGIGMGCDKEALRVIRNAPAWNPGRQRGRPVKVKRRVPVSFNLGD